MLILDFDLDFVVRPIRRGAADQLGRYENPEITVWSKYDFQSFLENRMVLSRADKVAGQTCEHHKEVFFHVQNLITSGVLVPPFHWVHVDAHDDIQGCSDAVKINSANFILHLIGKDWIQHLDFVLPNGEDRPPECLIKWSPLRIEFANHKTTIEYKDEVLYKLQRKPDFVFLTRSPDFTPIIADELFEMATNYINLK
jgi:hypothetical protein